MAIGANLFKTQPSFWQGMLRAFDFFGDYDRNDVDLSALDPENAFRYDAEKLHEDARKAFGAAMDEWRSQRAPGDQ